MKVSIHRSPPANRDSRNHSCSTRFKVSVVSALCPSQAVSPTNTVDDSVSSRYHALRCGPSDGRSGHRHVHHRSCFGWVRIGYRCDGCTSLVSRYNPDSGCDLAHSLVTGSLSSRSLLIEPRSPPSTTPLGTSVPSWLHGLPLAPSRLTALGRGEFLPCCKACPPSSSSPLSSSSRSLHDG